MEDEAKKADNKENPANQTTKPVVTPAATQSAKPVIKRVVKRAVKPADTAVVKTDANSVTASVAKPAAVSVAKPDVKSPAKKADKKTGKVIAQSAPKPSVKEKTSKVPGEKKKKHEKFNYELRIDLLGKAIKKARKERNLTQKELGQLVGVKKAQISKLENSLTDARFETIIKVFKALNVKINFNVELLDQTVTLN